MRDWYARGVKYVRLVLIVIMLMLAVISVTMKMKEFSQARCLNSAVKTELCDVDTLGSATYRDLLHWHNAIH